MNDILDKQLCEKYPKLFKERHANMQETCMCWGFEHGDGWYNIIDALCSNIQHHVSWARRQRASALVYNRVLKRALNGDIAGLEWFHTAPGTPQHRIDQRVNESLEEAKYHDVPARVRQVVVEQVKEKFGSLRFYYRGGDEQVYGMTRMAESMSAVTCEECGAPGTTTGKGWLKTTCKDHAR